MDAVHVQYVGDVAVVTFGEDLLDVSNADDFRTAMNPVLAECRKLVLDLSRVEFMDSRGCGAIIACLKNLSAAGGDLKLCRVTRPVRTVLELIRLHRICEIADTWEEAVQSFEKASGRKP